MNGGTSGLLRQLLTLVAQRGSEKRWKEKPMPRKLNYIHVATLEPGYYLLNVKLTQNGKGGSLFFEDECKPLKVEFKNGGSILLRLRKPTKIGVGAARHAILDYAKLGTARAVYIKLLNRVQLKLRIPMLDGAGYICILSGIEDRENIPRLRREAAAQREFLHFRLDDESLVNPRLFDNPFELLPMPETPWRPSAMSSSSTGIVLHLYYTDLWPEFALFLNTIKRPFHLWITHCGMSAALHNRIVQTFPQAQLIQVENRGRDVWPFMSLLNAGAFDTCDCICKLHSKKSLRGSGTGESLFGSRWRRRTLYDLLAFGRADMVIEKFEHDPGLGMLGPGSFRIPNDRCDLRMAWGAAETRNKTLEIASRLGTPMSDNDLDFFAGSMFWTKRAALKPLLQLGLRRQDFPEEHGQLDGTTHHALERLFPRSALLAGFSLGVVPPVTIEEDLVPTARAQAT